MAATILCQQALPLSPPFPAAFLSSTGEPFHRLCSMWFDVFDEFHEFDVVR